MRFPKYWTRVSNPSGTVVARGWSEVSLDEATHNARSRLQRILAALKAQRQFDLDRYSYLIDNVICEEVIERIAADDQPTAVISRNAYGALVLNSPKVLFADVDFPPPQRPGCLWGWLQPAKPISLEVQEQTVEPLRDWQARNPGIGLRIYRTAAGVRVIVTNLSFASVDDNALSILKAFGSDDLYVQLCRSQDCFRARLTPKPWRVGQGKPPRRFPFQTPEERQAFESWYTKYLARARRAKVCSLLESLGPAEMPDANLRLVELHDSYCLGADDLQLA